MHDGLTSYEKSIPTYLTLYCWAHVLRYAYEETFLAKEGCPVFKFRQQLVVIYRLKEQKKTLSKDKFYSLISQHLNTLINQKSKDIGISHIQERLKKQKEGLTRALWETEDGTNNLAERELRPIVIGKRISFGSDTYTGMETTAVLGSIIQTLSRHEETLLLRLRLYLTESIRQQNQQYLHSAYFDDS